MSKNNQFSLKGSQIFPKPRTKNFKSDSRVTLIGKLRPNSATHDRKYSLGKSSETVRPKSANDASLYEEKQKQSFKKTSKANYLQNPVKVSESSSYDKFNKRIQGDTIDHVKSSSLVKHYLISSSTKSEVTDLPNTIFASEMNLLRISEDCLNEPKKSFHHQTSLKCEWITPTEEIEKNPLENLERVENTTVTAKSTSKDSSRTYEEHEKSQIDEDIWQSSCKTNQDKITFNGNLIHFTEEEEDSLKVPDISNAEKTLVSLLAELENEVISSFQSNSINDSHDLRSKESNNATGTLISSQEQNCVSKESCGEINNTEQLFVSHRYSLTNEICSASSDDCTKNMQIGHTTESNVRLSNSSLKSPGDDDMVSSPSKEVEKVLKASRENLQKDIVEILDIQKHGFHCSSEGKKNYNNTAIEGRPSCIGKSARTWNESPEIGDNAKIPETFQTSTNDFLENITNYLEEEHNEINELPLTTDKRQINVMSFKTGDKKINRNSRKYREENDGHSKKPANKVDVKNHIETLDLESGDLSDDDSMYDDVVSALKVIEKEENETAFLSSRPPPTGSESENTPRIKLMDILTFLDSVDQPCTTNINSGTSDLQTREAKSDHVKFSSKESEDDISNKSAPSNEILEMRLQEQAKGLSLMKKELKETRKRLQKEKEDLRKNLKEENEKVIQRHQEFIQKLLSEKQALADKCESLTSNLKQTEENHKRNLSAMEERHALSLRNERERIRLEQRATRDKWMREKTQKIQAITAKGAEGEVHRLVSEQVHQIEALWRARLDELRGRLEREAEEGMSKERETARKRLEERVEELERFHQEERRKFLSEECVLRGRAEEAERKVREIEEDARRRRADDLDAERTRFQAKLEKATQEMENHYQISLSKERAQREIAMETARKEERDIMEADRRKWEAKLKDRFRAERDQGIEKAVAHLSAQTEKVQLEAEARAEMSLRRMRERCDEQVRIAEEEAEKQRKQCADLRSQSAVLQEEESVLKLTVSRLEKELESAHKMNNSLYEERAQIRDLVVEEWSSRVAALREEVGVLKAQIAGEKDRKEIELVQVQKERELELIQIRKRVEMAVAKKEETINQLKAKYEGALIKCSQLQELLEKQRTDLLLK